MIVRFAHWTLELRREPEECKLEDYGPITVDDIGQRVVLTKLTLRSHMGLWKDYDDSPHGDHNAHDHLVHS